MRLSGLLPPFGLLAVLAGAFASSLSTEINGSKTLPGDNSPDADLPTAAASATALMLPAPSNVAAAIDLFAARPLFAEGRRTAEAATPSLPEPAPEPQPEMPATVVVQAPGQPLILMIGMMETNGNRKALVRDLSDNEERWITEGEVIGAWTLAQITQGAIRLEVEGAEITFNLFQERLP